MHRDRLSFHLAWWLLVATFAAYAFWFVYQRGADLNFDLLNYHFFSGYAIYEGRLGQDLAPSGLYTFFNPYWDVITYVANSRLGFPWNSWVLLTIQLFSLLPLIGILRELETSFELPHASVEGMLAFCLCVLSPVWLSELGTSFFSSDTAFFILLALWLVIRAVSDRAAPSPSIGFLLAGVLAGLATGLKLTNMVFLLALPFGLMPLLLRGDLRLASRLGAYYFVGALLGTALTAWWNYYLLIEWGSPIYPFFNRIFQSPYWEPYSFRDIRWKFHSPSELLAFAANAWQLTTKTSESPFADGRLPIAGLAIGVTAVIQAVRFLRSRGPVAAQRSAPAPAAVLWFAGVAFGLWALVFAYQRYLIPVELLAGLILWILVRKMFRSAAAVLVMLLILGCCAWVISVPDWDHDKGLLGHGADRFGLEIPHELISTPAVYLVSKKPISYVFAFLHPDSRFLRIDFTPLADERLRGALATSGTLPVRILTFDNNDADLLSVARKLGIPLPAQALDRCYKFKSAVHRFVTCELVTGRPTRTKEE